MVDSINPVGPLQNTQSVKSNAQKNKDSAEATQSSSSPVDEVEISQEALNIAQAEQAASSISSALQENPNETLSADADRLNALA